MTEEGKQAQCAEVKKTPDAESDVETEAKTETGSVRSVCNTDKRKPGMESDNDVDRLMAAPRIIPASCVDQCDTRLITFRACNPSTFHYHGTEGGHRTLWVGDHFPAGQSASWMYDMTAWDTVQRKGHSDTGGSCLGMEQTETWSDVVAFYNKHRLANYCSITAERMVWTKGNTIVLDEKTHKFSHIDKTGDVKDAGVSGMSQYATLYLRCVGCACVDGVLEDLVARGEPSPGCTDHLGKPGVATAHECKAIAAYLERKVLGKAVRSIDARIKNRRRNMKKHKPNSAELKVSHEKLRTLRLLKAKHLSELKALCAKQRAQQADDAQEDLAIANA